MQNNNLGSLLPRELLMICSCYPLLRGQLPQAYQLRIGIPAALINKSLQKCEPDMVKIYLSNYSLVTLSLG